jgi:hypothetical protein
MPASRSEWSEFGTVNGLAKLTLLAGFRAAMSEWPTILLNSESSPQMAQITQVAKSAQRIGRDDNGRSTFTVSHLLLPQ